MHYCHRYNFFQKYFRRKQSPDPSVGTRLEGLLLDELDDDFNPRAYEQSVSDQKSQSSPVNNTSPVTPPMCKYVDEVLFVDWNFFDL